MELENAVKKILVVDDEEFNLDILDEYLKDASFETVLAKNGLEAIAKLEENMPIDAIILDRMMPILDGMGVLSTIKSIEKYKHIPVIMQTAAGTQEQIVEGIQAGVFYYLTKPYEKTTLLTILNSALEQQILQKRTIGEAFIHKNAIKLMAYGTFTFKTMEDAKNLSFAISNIFSQPEKIVFGLNELTVNAVEHGNLGISFEEKKKFVIENSLHQEIENRLKMPEYSEKFATLTFSTHPTHYEIIIKDMGNGFDHTKFINFDPARLTDPSGRGIAMSKMYSFDDIKYLGNGNELVCKVNR
jgi:CheY-like chemotaxis protein